MEASIVSGTGEMHITTIVERDETTTGGFVYLARDPNLPGCMAHGGTVDEAIVNLNEARELYCSAGSPQVAP